MMSSDAHTDHDCALVLSRDAAADGLTAVLRTHVAHGRLTRIRRGAYTPATAFARLDDTQRYRARVLATLATRTDAVVTSYSAAVLCGLPMIGAWPEEVYLLSGTASGRRRNGMVELGRRGHEPLIHWGGWRMTSVPCTLIHICRTARYVSALALVDAALHVDRFERMPPLTILADLTEQAERMLPFPGSARTARVLHNATTLAESSFETLSRVTIDELGFPQPVLQHRLQLPLSGREIFTDFAWPEYAVVGEADGRGKYLGGGHEPVNVSIHKVLDEKKREDEVRGLGLAVARWDWNDALRRTPLKAILLQQGLPIVRRPRTFL